MKGFKALTSKDQKSVSVVIPARNEDQTISRVVRSVVNHANIAEVIVVDNGSSDNTNSEAKRAGARVIHCPEIGLGRAMKAGLLAARSRFVLRTDADIDNWNDVWIDLLTPPSPFCLHRGIYLSPYNQLPISNYVVRPFFELYRKEWAEIPIPTTGTYLFDKSIVNISELPDNWAIDVAILVSFLKEERSSIKNVKIGTLSDAVRPVSHYIPMATEINEYLTRYFWSEISDKHFWMSKGQAPRQDQS